MKLRCELQLVSATINPEKAGGDTGEVGSALRFDGDVLVDKLAGLFADELAFKRLVEVLYGSGQDLVARDVGHVKLTTDLEKVKAIIGGPVSEDERLTFTACKLNGVVLTPGPGRSVNVQLKLYVHPDDEQWNEIASLARKTVLLRLSGGKEVEKEEGDEQPSLPIDAPAAAPAAPVH